jgi:hypothetical protein
MTVYVDPLMDHGWILRGESVRSCHMFTDALDLEELHAIARRIGCRRSWFQEGKRMPHYDLTMLRRQEAIGCGAVPVTRREAVEIWHARAARLAAGQEAVAALRCPECPCHGYCERTGACARRAP